MWNWPSTACCKAPAKNHRSPFHLSQPEVTMTSFIPAISSGIQKHQKKRSNSDDNRKIKLRRPDSYNAQPLQQEPDSATRCPPDSATDRPPRTTTNGLQTARQEWPTSGINDAKIAFAKVVETLSKHACRIWWSGTKEETKLKGKNTKRNWSRYWRGIATNARSPVGGSIRCIESRREL